MIPLFIQLVGSYCNTSEGLPEGYTCCNNETCLSSHCNIDEYETETYVMGVYQSTKHVRNELCYNDRQYKYCYQIYNSLLLTAGCCLIPTVLVIVFQFICSYRVPLVNIICNIISNFGCGLALSVLPCTDIMMVANYAILGVGLFIMFFILIVERCNCCLTDAGHNSEPDLELGIDDFYDRKRVLQKERCKLNLCDICFPCSYGCILGCCHYDCLEVLNEVRLNPISSEELTSVMTSNATSSPKPEAEAIEYYR